MNLVIFFGSRLVVYGEDGFHFLSRWVLASQVNWEICVHQ